MTDAVIDLLKGSEEPEWLEKPVVGGLRVWQIIFLCLAGMTTLTVMICCCFRFRIPRTKQQIEADYQRRIITAKFRQQLETIQDSKMDAMSLTDVLELLHEKNKPPKAPEKSDKKDTQNSSALPQPPHSHQPTESETRDAQASSSGGAAFVKFANKVAHLSRLAQPRSPTSPTDVKIMF